MGRSDRTPYETVTVLLLGALTIALDQFAKFAIVAVLTLGQSRPLIDGLLSLTYVQNLGSAFSLFWGQGGFLVLVGCAVAAGIVVYQWRARRTEPLVVLALGLLLGGALGNLIDRVALGYVRDMIDLQWQGRNVFPIFNVADMAICAGTALLGLHAAMSDRRRPAADRIKRKS